MNNHRPVVRVKARQAPKYAQSRYGNWLFAAVAMALLVIVMLSASSVRAQYPRIGISGSPDAYIDSLDVMLNETFTLYVCVFGPDAETPLDQEYSSLSWVLHQVCCGAILSVENVVYNTDFQHEGSPGMGVVSSSEVCVDEPVLLLATMTMSLFAEEDGGYLAACGPYQQPVDCDGGNPILMGMGMQLNLSGAGGTPNDSLGLQEIKALYR